MMRFSGTHTTKYAYSSSVFLEPHTMRLRPRSDPRQHVKMFSIDISPAPDGITEAIDAWDNDVVRAWFSGTHDSLEITTRFVVETHWENPFDFIVPGPDAEGLSPGYGDDERAALAPYLVTEGDDPAVRGLADEAARASASSVAAFPSELARRIHERCEMIHRPTGPPLPAAETLATGRGSCRDLTVLFMEASRCVGVAARFISGYAAHATPGEEHELHAWGGVYIPGGGWRPYDPSRGLAVAQGHIQIAAAARPAGAAPVEGSFRGSGAQSELTTHISLDVT